MKTVQMRDVDLSRISLPCLLEVHLRTIGGLGRIADLTQALALDHLPPMNADTLFAVWPNEGHLLEQQSLTSLVNHGLVASSAHPNRPFVLVGKGDKGIWTARLLSQLA